ncbi:TetR/AcrR family transcriptional regulator C-terminal ligand-binding domain-containing protein [Streptomyces roseirectus]|uniref:TetR/AcrR family transcriptional regulator C-terminal ligand-binding domain-containing protein n=1 Tax=Streptomyces roseirectus TaxID=2768066 RepID=A0A7H0IN82_9ACTN|nr:TetR-like C-terminal domain-containing protein [Streptomyces roseirectus]QNP74248.1 TetR/AcrR family transcriptional regulator C-terminal ligand-binding domain-containing protein [Streptomyces roseirectus]
MPSEDPREDPRARRSRTAALAAAAQLLGEGGPENVTHAAVAARAGVGRATVYRHWPDLRSLLLATLAGSAPPLLVLGDGPVRDQLVDQLITRAHWLNQPVSASVVATVVERAERDAAVRRLRERMFGRGDAHLAQALAVAVSRGELLPGAEQQARTIVTHLLGPLLFRRYMLGERLDAAAVETEVDRALAPWLAA